MIKEGFSGGIICELDLEGRLVIDQEDKRGEYSKLRESDMQRPRFMEISGSLGNSAVQE